MLSSVFSLIPDNFQQVRPDPAQAYEVSQITISQYMDIYHPR